MNRPTFPIAARMFRLSLFVAAALGWGAAVAVDISQSPLATSSNTAVKPNIMLIVDDSSTMAYDYLPDSASVRNWCFGYSAFNGMFYNPNIAYVPPLTGDSAGTRYANATFNSAWDDGFAGGTRTNLAVLNNLTTPSVADPSCKNNCSNTKFYYSTYTGTSAFSSGACSQNKYSIVTSLPANQQQNYANWYSYYRTRILMTRSAAGEAFGALDPSYRVGFSTINETGVTDNSRFLNIRNFDTTQRGLFYSKLYATLGNVPGTPLRGALAKAGQYFADKAPGQTASNDPVQYSCQQNFAVLATDGQWNTNTESGSYGPYRLDNSTYVGQQDFVSESPKTPATPYIDDCHTRNECGGQNPTSSTGYGADNALADVAWYYYWTPLRTTALGNCNVTVNGATNNVCGNNVTGIGADTNTAQHMTTFTLGLGTAGLLKYVPNYETSTDSATNDYYNILQGTMHWPAPYAAGGANPGAANIDDLWHAAVNGHGHYFSTSDPQSLSSSLTTTLLSIQATLGSASAAATSNLQPVAGDNYVFVATYETQNWVGDLKEYTIDPTTGVLSTTAAWSAQSKLDATTWSNRTIYYSIPGSGSTRTLKSFVDTNLSADGLMSNFSSMCSGATPKLSQCPTLNSTQQASTSGTNLVNFLRGDQSNETTNSASPLYRPRTHILGDVISAAPVYVSKPPFRYADSGYATFQTNNATRAPTVYVAANDGMLHAFDATTGNELWAYIPSMVLSNLYRLADVAYPTNHHFFVDGSPTIGDVWDGSNWRTILVGGLNGGGRGYYALDVTRPSSPIALWEFADGDLGLSYGNPVIAKRKDGTWVVAFGSGYTDGSFSTTTGNGNLYVLNAVTGQQLLKIPTYTTGTTPAGTTANPSGLAKINAWVDSETDNTAARFYGGDMLGNIWRFDIDSNVQPYGAALRLANLSVGATPQPVTVKPELAQISYNGARIAVVFVGTGRYLGTTDLTDTSQQSVYAFKDNLTATGLGNLRSDPTMVQQTLTQTTNTAGQLIRTASANLVNWQTNDGWYVDFNPGNHSPGERVNVQMQQQFSELSVATNVPGTEACAPGGTSWLYHFDINTGSYLATADSNAAGTWLGNQLTAGIVTVELANGKTVTIVTETTGKIDVKNDPGTGGSGALAPRRTSWRELVN